MFYDGTFLIVLTFRKRLRDGGWDPHCSLPVVKKVILEDDKVVYQLWEGYHRITALRTIKSENPDFFIGEIKFVLIRADADDELLFDYCVGIKYFSFHLNILILI